MIKIGSREIGPHRPIWLIVETGVTHVGDLERAFQLIDAAAKAGAEAVKFQVCDPDRLLSNREEPFRYELGGAATVERPIYDVLSEVMTFTPAEWARVRDRCHARGVQFFATADYEEGVDLLDALDVPAHKCSSWDITHLPLLQRMARGGKPVLVDLATCTSEEALRVRKTLGDQAIFLHAPHPTRAGDWHLSRLEELRRRSPWGYSSPDRQEWPDALAVFAGTHIVEKRLTLDRLSTRGHHHWISLEPPEYAEWARRVRQWEQWRTEGPWGPGSLLASAERLRWGRSVVTVRHVARGATLVASDLAIKRPGGGIAPSFRDTVVGRLAVRDLEANTVLRWEDVTP